MIIHGLKEKKLSLEVKLLFLKLQYNIDCICMMSMSNCDMSTVHHVDINQQFFSAVR